MIKVEKNLITGSFSEARPKLVRRIKSYAKNNNWIYVGLTQQRPGSRFSQHQLLWAKGYKWDRMIVVYKARSFNHMVKMEHKLIKYAFKKHFEKTYNVDAFLKPPKRSDSPDGYWIYVLVQKNT